MKIFSCTKCGNLLYFENVTCTQCGASLGFLPDSMRLTALESAGGNEWQASGTEQRYRMCANYSRHAVCNWMVKAGTDLDFCEACSLNRTIPDLSVEKHRKLWRTLETEKRRLIYSLLNFDLPVVSRKQDPAGLAFDFLADEPARFSERGRVMTGHNQGLITINIAEADPAERERMRNQMAEAYRTILGHFRHESGHYYWDRLIRDTDRLQPFRDLFGDDRIDYSKSLEKHYHDGPPADWQQRFVSAYASSHPWEDWAESWAHYLHMVDTLETAYQYGLAIRPVVVSANARSAEHDFNAYGERDFEVLIEHWFPLTFALNSLNRSMGHRHAYPFVLAPAAIDKLRFVHRVIWETVQHQR
ncbi:MAG: putative zinc-binding peptidase [Ketobacteraceae bacterium]|nr:putative zinc-binding peptidase [Ketobacteraceae bacterium]